MVFLALSLAALLAAVAWGYGGYDPWAILTLELGATALVLVLVVRGLWLPEADADLRLRRLAAWRRLPFWSRHLGLASLLRILTLGAYPRTLSTPEVEILLPGERGSARVELDLGREVFFFGYPVKRNGLLLPLALLTLWIGLSLVPLQRAVLEHLSPEASALRTDAERLVELAPGPAPSSLAPFLTFRSLWLWLAIIALFYVAFRVASSVPAISRFSLSLLLLGAASGALGLFGWLTDLHGAFGKASEALRATGSFGNPNHYAAFQSMLLLVSVGWLGHFRESARTRRGAVALHPRSPRHRRAPRPGSWNEGALAAIAGLGVVVLSLGLLLSLSRSGITSALAGAIAFVFLIRRRGPEAEERSSRRVLLALALTAVGLVVWMGIEPLVGRFANLEDQWEREGTRIQVWRDSLPAVGDFWLTGSGLSSFRYVGARYRTFGGRIFYSWAHNDYLQLGIELGVPGLLLLSWLFWAVARSARRARGTLSRDAGLVQLHAGYLAAIVAITLHSFTDFSLHLSANFALLAMLVGAVVGMELRDPAELEERRR